MEFVSLAFLLGLWSEESFFYSTVTGLYAVTLSSLFFVLKILKNKNRKESYFLGGFAIIFLFLFAGVVRGQFLSEEEFIKKEEHPFLFHVKNIDFEEKSVVYEGITDDGERVVIRADVMHEVDIGDTLTVYPPWKENFFMSTKDKKSLINRAGNLSVRGVSHEIAFPSFKKEKKSLTERERFSLADELVSFREKSAEKMKRYLPLREADLANGMLFGDRYLTTDEKELFRNAGVSHIVALSGFNISVVTAFLLVLMRFMPFLIRALIVSCFVTFYVMMVDMSGSLLRASAMSLLSGLLLLFGARGDERKILFASLLVIAFFFPKTVLYNTSLHLSYGALIGVLYIYPALFEDFVRSCTGYRKAVLVVLCESVSVSIILIPYMTHFFHSLSFLGILVSTLITPFVPLATTLSLLLLLFTYLFPLLATFLSIPLFVICSLIYGIAERVSHISLLSFSIELSQTGLMLYYIVLTTILFILKRMVVSTKNIVYLKEEKNPNIIEGVIRY